MVFVKQAKMKEKRLHSKKGEGGVLSVEVKKATVREKFVNASPAQPQNHDEKATSDFPHVSASFFHTYTHTLIHIYTHTVNR